MRKLALFSLAIVVALSMVGLASAAQLTANTTQKGSLLFWPKIIAGFEPTLVGSDGPAVETGIWNDTIIYLGNDNTVGVWVQCYWMFSDQSVQDFEFYLTPAQPIAWEAGLGVGDFIFAPPVTMPPFDSPDGAGALFCWAVKDDPDPVSGGEKPIVFNHLYGNALIVSGSINATNDATDEQAQGLSVTVDSTVLYNAYSFAARDVGTNPAQLSLDSTHYDACPSYLVSNFTPDAGFFFASGDDIDAHLTLVPCKQDLRQDRTPTYTKAQFDVWNANEVKFTGAWRCLWCFNEFDLDDLGTTCKSGSYSPGTGCDQDKFELLTLKSFAARFRVQGVKSTMCSGSQASPLLGLLMYRDELTDAQTGKPSVLARYWAGTTLFGGGIDKTGFILWDPNGAPQEAPPGK